MSEASKAAQEYQAEQLTQGGEWCCQCWQRRGDPRDHFLAGALALLEWARSKAQFMSDEDGEGVDRAVDIADLEAYFAEESK